MFNPPRLCPLNEDLIIRVLAKTAVQKQRFDNEKKIGMAQATGKPVEYFYKS